MFRTELELKKNESFMLTSQKAFHSAPAWVCFSKHLSIFNFKYSITVAGVTLPNPSCQDNSKHKAQCPAYAYHGECQKNTVFMKVNCPASCGVCGKYTKILLLLLFFFVCVFFFGSRCYSEIGTADFNCE